eukprot:m.233549 g.233549  ORF g.233549 m.233549 type:complete len:2254 (+) comp40090_c2_seq1:205-6966(+)
MTFLLGVVALLALTGGAAGQTTTTLQVVPPGSSATGALSNGQSSIYEVPVQPPFPADVLWVQIIASRPTASDQCNGNSLALFTSNSLSDVQSLNPAYAAFPYKNCPSKIVGQIEQYRLPLTETKIFVAVRAKSQGSFRLDVSYRGKETGTPFGILAAKQSHPWHVMIRRSNNAGTKEPFCSGSLISPHWIITAAQCLQNVKAQEEKGLQFDVRLGAYTTQGDDLQTVAFTGDDIYVQDNGVINDVGLLRLSHPASVSQKVAPISLPDVDDQDWIQTGIHVESTYWNLDFHATSSIGLHQSSYSLLSGSRCIDLMQNADLLADDHLPTGSSHICAISSQSDCSGDLGSPLVATHKGVSFLVGVFSSGYACRNSNSNNATFFTNIMSYSSRINDALSSTSMSAYWYPQATRLQFQYSHGGKLKSGSGPFRGVLMTLETYSYTPSTATYYGWRNPPHFTVHGTGVNVHIYQHFPVNVAARALMQGEQTNANVIEIALAWKSPEIDTLSGAFNEKLAELMRWIEMQTGIKRVARQFYKPLDAYGTGSQHRMTELEWKYFNGWCGRQHVPGIANPDPGMLQTDVLLSHNVPVRKYDVEVHTNDGSVTAPNTIEVSLAGLRESSPSYPITAGKIIRGSLLAGAVAQFSLTANENLGTLNRIRVVAKGSGYRWLLKGVQVTNTAFNLKFTFPCNQWFDDGMTSHLFSLDGVVPTGDYTELPRTGTLQEVAEGHGDCSLSSTRGITNQIFHQFYCDNDNALADISSYPQLCIKSSVIPYLQIDAAKSLKRLLDDDRSKKSLTISSAIRSLPDQYVLSQWQKQGACRQINRVDFPGKSDYMEGVVVDVRQFNQFKLNGSQYGFSWAGNATDNRFTFKGSRLNTVEVQNGMIESFQKLWNLNNPLDTIAVNGQWNNLTATKLSESPLQGFPISPSCSYVKPKIPCCIAGSNKGQCTTTEACLGRSSCLKLSSNEANLCDDDVFTTCCAITQLKSASSMASQPLEHVYDVILYTGDQPDSTSNVDTNIKLRGTLGESENIILKASKGYKVQPGSVLHYNFSVASSLGEIQFFDIGHSDTTFGSGFYLKNITVTVVSSDPKKEFVFPCNCWLDSSQQYIKRALQRRQFLRASDFRNCSNETLNSEGTVKTVVEANPGCTLSEARGLAQQIADQTLCNSPLLLSELSSDSNFCVQNEVFPYFLYEAHLSLRERINPSLQKSFTVTEGMQPLVFQFIRQKWGERRLCGLDEAVPVGTGAFDRGNALAVTETDKLIKLLPTVKWKISSARTYIKFFENSSDIVEAQLRAFQQLWNVNNPKMPIPVDGVLSQTTIKALLKSPAKGFASGAQCRLPKKVGSPCCTADKKKGTCVGIASCEPSDRRQGYCSNSGSVCCVGRSPVEIEFPSGIKLEKILPPVKQAADFIDPFHRGNPLMNGAGKEDALVSTNFHLKDFFDPSVKYLRLSPLLVRCIQSAQDNSESEIYVKTGFQTKGTSQNSSSSFVYQTGAAAVIQFKNSGSSLLLAENVLKGCLKLVRNHGSDLGIGLQEYSLHLELRDHFDAWALPATGMSDQQFTSWSQRQITEIETAVFPTPACQNVSPLTIGETLPSAKDAAAACGKIDHIIKRYSLDFDSLVQYPGSQVAFSSEEKDDAWCGWSNRKCVDCRTQTKGYSMMMKCADRVMSMRLMNRLAILQRMVAKELPGHVIVVHEAWEEVTSNSSYEWGSFDSDSLHYEGRAADISISANLTLAPNHLNPPLTDERLLGKLSAMASCAGFDHVWYKNKQRIQVSVRKAEGVGRVVSFPYVDFICASSPSDKADLYAVRKASSYLLEDTCLFDSDGRENELLTKEHPVKMFLSSETSRYFRLHHLIPKTLNLIGERLWADHGAKVSIEKAYETNDNQEGKLHSLGQGIEIKSADAQVTILELASAVIETAADFLLSFGLGLGMELSENSLYYDVRPSGLDLWSTSNDIIQKEWEQFVKLGLQRASRRIFPSKSEENCFNVPSAPSSTYAWQSTSFYGNSTMRKTACKEDDDSIEHCKSTWVHRQEQVEVLWNKLQGGHHFVRSEDDVKNALINCFSDLCGKCFEGEVWEKKREHCSNFIHWVPLDFGNGENGAIFVAENGNAQETACEEYSCLEKTEVYSVLAPSLFGLYPVQKGSSTKDEIYSPGSNPLPTMELLQETFAMNLKGKVTMVVENEKEMSSLKNSLKVLTAYNKNITEVVIFTFKAEVDGIRDFIEKAMVEWSSSVCSSLSRKYFTEFKFRLFDE